MGKADRISGIFWFIFSVYVTIESYRLGLGSLRKPGPGFFFFWTGILLAIMSLTVILRSWREKKSAGEKEPFFGKLNLTKIVLVMISLFLYALFMEKLGFLPVTLLLFVFLLGIIEKKRWSLTLLVSLAVTAISYLIFEILLKSQLPKGLLEFLRF